LLLPFGTDLSLRGVNCIMDPISKEQHPLIDHLIKLANLKIDISTLQVKAMDDGGMGSQKFSSASENSVFGSQVAEATFADSDGVEVTGALCIDQYGNLFELDMFKTNFSKLEKWPDENELKKTT